MCVKQYLLIGSVDGVLVQLVVRGFPPMNSKHVRVKRADIVSVNSLKAWLLAEQKLCILKTLPQAPYRTWSIPAVIVDTPPAPTTVRK